MHNLETFNNHLGNITNDIRNSVVRLYPIFLNNEIQMSLTIVNQKREKGEIPSGLKEQFIEDLIERGECICGQQIIGNIDAIQHLKSLIKNKATTEFEDKVIQLPGHIRGINEITNHNLDNLNRLCKEKSDVEVKINDLSRKIDEIGHKLEGSQDIDIGNLERKLSTFEENQKYNEQLEWRFKNECDDIENKIKDKVKQREIEEKKQKELLLLSRKEELARKATEAVKKIKYEFYEQTRLLIEKETKKVFSDLAWKHDQFCDIQLDPDFHLEIIDRWGFPSREEISAGERQILSLAFICAMVNLSGEVAPIIMDTPFGRLSSNHLDAVATSLPKLVPQLILLVTDREWNTASKSKLEPFIGNIYNLEFDETTGCTEIKEVPFV